MNAAKLLLVATCIIAAMTTQTSNAKNAPNPSDIVTLAYNSKHITTLKLHYGHQSLIEFAQNEVIQSFHVGNENSWRLTPAQNRLFIDPLATGVTSVLTVITNIRTYNFSLKSDVYRGAKDQTLLSAVRFAYP